MAIALAILVAFLVLEATVGILINSLALLADAGHMLTDVVGMAMGLTALLLAKRGSTTAARTFGWHRAEVLTAFGTALILLVWINYFSRVVLYAAAWAHTDARSAGSTPTEEESEVVTEEVTP